MKKIIFIVLILIAATLLIGPFFSGKAAEKEAYSALTAFNAKNSYGKNEILSYERGFSSSEAKLRYSPPITLNKNGDNIINYNCNINHRVIGVKYKCKLDQSGKYGEFVQKHLDGKDPLSFEMSASATGSLEYQVDLESFQAKNLPDGKEGIINVKSAALSIDTDKDISFLNHQGSFNGLTIKDNNGELNIGKSTISGESKKLEELVFIGNVKAKISSIISNSSDKENMSFKNLLIDIDQGESKETIDTEMVISIDSIDTSKKEVGEIEDLKLAFDWLNLDKEALIAYTKTMQDIQKTALNSSNNKKQAFQQQMQAKSLALVPLIEKFFQKDTEINAQVSGKVSGKKNSMKLNLKLNEALTMADSMMFAFAPEEALKKINLTVQGSIDDSLVKKSPNLSLINSSPMFKNKRGTYTMDLELGKKIELNGEKMSINELQEMVLSAAPLR